MDSNVQLPDFDTLAALHRNDPEAFEQLRRQLLQEAVAAAPARYRPHLEKVLERIESTHDAAATPMEAAIAASRMMQESLASLLAAWKQAQYKMAGLQADLLIERCRLTH